ncbi:putative reverse transcriptase domain-containing protein, partial [Tanacetum coccineum]
MSSDSASSEEPDSPEDAPASPDYMPGPEEPKQAPLSPDYVPGPEYPEYLAPSDEEVPVEDQPYVVADSPIALSLGYVADSDPEEDSEDGPIDYPADRGDGDDDDDKEEDEHLAPANSVVAPVVDHVPSSEETELIETDESAATPPSPPAYRTTARISIRPEAPMPFPSEEEVERLLALPPPPPSPLISLSPPSAEERLARCLAAPALPSSPLLKVPHPYGSPNLMRAPSGFRAAMGRLRASSPSTYHPLHPSPPLPPPPSSLHLPPHVPTSLPLPSSPLPPLPVSLFIPPPVDRKEDTPKTELPPRKRLCLTALTSRYKVEESSTAAPRPTRGHGIELWVYSPFREMPETRRQRAEEVSPNHVRAPPGFRAAMGRLRASSPSTHHLLHPSPLLPPPPSSLHLPPHVPTSLPLPSSPLPPLPASLFIPPSVDHREDIPEDELPPRKRLCLTTLTSRYEVGESSTAAPRPTGGYRADYGFIGTMDAEIRRQLSAALGQILALQARDQTHADDCEGAASTAVGLVRTPHECTYKDFLNCKPLSFKGTEGVKALKKMMIVKYCPRGEIKKLEIKLWNLKVKGTDVASYTLRFQELVLMCGRMFHEESDEVEKYVGGLPDMIRGNVMSYQPKTVEKAIEFANDQMDKKVLTIAERQTEQKRKLEFNAGNNQGHQQQNNRQNTKRAYTAGPGEKRECTGSLPLCTKCNYHHKWPCAPRCNKCKKIGHLARNCRSSGPNGNNNNRGNSRTTQNVGTCYKCDVQGHFKRDCPKLKNKNRGNQGGNGNAPAKVYVVGNAETNPDSNVVT